MDAETQLLSILSSHASSLGPDDVSWAFTTPKTAEPVTNYIHHFLQPSTLLSIEEAQIVAHLQKNGTWNKLTPCTITPPKSEDEIRSETEELDASTALLRQQTAELQKRTAMLEAMRSRRRAERERRKKLEVLRRRKWAGERDEMTAARDDLLGILREEVRDLRDTVSDPAEEGAEVGKILEGDDRVLNRLEIMAAELVVADDEGGEGEMVARVEALVERLATLETRAVRKRLERVFLENAKPGPAGEEEQGLQTELDSLYREIPAVAGGAAHNEFLSPLLSSMAAAAKDRGENWVRGGEYLCEVLQHMRSRLAAMTSLLSSCHDRDAAIMTLIATIEREAAALSSSPSSSSQPMDERPSTPPQQGQPKRLGSPVRFTEKLGRIPFLTPARRRGKSMDFSKDVYPELALFSHLGISLPPSSPTRNAPFPAPPVITDSFLDAQVAATAARVAHVSEISPQTPWEHVRAEAAAVARVLREALWSRNEFEIPERGEGAMVVVREGVRRGGMEVENGVKEIAGVMGKLVARVEELERERGDMGGEGRKMEFVDRWGR